ncbi:MAG: hypothetical protein ACI97A_000036 [Planctomycetota bacterium]|jgi:hypothetical protein
MKNDLLRKLGASRKRVIFAAILGLLLAYGLIWTKSNIYDPFYDDYDDLRVFVPSDADFAVFSVDLPTLIKGLEDRPFISQLDRNQNFGQFLNSDLVTETQIIPQIREAYRHIREIDSELPFDLKALGDLSGSEVVISGFAPETSDGDFGIIVAIQPQSNLAVAAANALMNSTLSGLFSDNLGAEEIEHFGWGVQMTFNQNGKRTVIGLARVERVLLIGTDIPRLARFVKNAKTEGILDIPEDRMDPNWVWSPRSRSAISVMVRSDFLLRRMDFHNNILIPMWGIDIAQAFERGFPQFSNGDAHLQVDCTTEADLKMSIDIDNDNGSDLFSKCGPLDQDEVQSQITEVVGKLPHHIFAYSAMGSHPADLLTNSLREKSIIDQDQRELLYAGLVELESFKRYKQPNDVVPEFPRPLSNKLKDMFDPGLGMVFFKKERKGNTSDGSPGFACLLKIKDELLLRDFIEEIDKAFKQPFDFFNDGVEFWRVSKKSFLDDAENNDPGFAIMGKYFVITNWARLFTETQEVIKKNRPSMPQREQLEYQIFNMTPGTKCMVFVDTIRLYDHMDQAKESWIEERSKIDELEKFVARSRLSGKWSRSGSNESEEKWVDREFETWLRATKSERSPVAIRRKVERNLDHFRDAFSYFYADIGQDGPYFRLRLSLATQENY